MFENFKNFFRRGVPTVPQKNLNNYILDRSVKMAHSPEDMKRMDNWSNILSGLGVYGMDKSLATVPYWQKLPYEEAASIYASDPLAKKIVKHIVESALIRDYRFIIGDKEEDFNIRFNKERKDRIDKKFKIKQLIYDAAVWARVFGTSYILVGADDGNKPDTPLDINKIKTIKWVKAFDAQEVFPFVGSFDPNSTNFLNPEYYTLATYGGSPDGALQIHHSRIIRFDGHRLLRRQYIRNGYTHDSVLNPVKHILANYNQAITALGIMIQEWSIGIFKIKGIEHAIASGNEEMVTRRISLIDKCKSIIRSVIIGKEEEYQRMSGQYSGVDSIAQFLRKELATHVDIPHTILFNEGPSSGAFGLSSGKGESEISDWQAIVSQYQEHYLMEPIQKLYRILFKAADNTLTAGKLPKFELEFSAARTLSRDEEADVYQMFASGDREYLGMGVITPQEIRESRFSDTGTFKDLDTRIELSDKTVLDEPVPDQPVGPESEAEKPPSEEGGEESEPSEEGPKPPKEEGGSSDEKEEEEEGKEEEEKPKKKEDSIRRNSERKLKTRRISFY